jgi:ubiquinone/menaquinone biosynthesis C-methylase UbiE
MTHSAGFYNTIARFYDAENAGLTEDLVLYSELADENGDPVLDVGCGSGRVMLHLAQQGFTVVGVDHSEVMLARGQRRLAAAPDLKPLVTFVKGDVLTVDLPGLFKLIIVPYNTLMHFNTQERQLAALRRFHEWLDDEGLLVLDLPNAGEAFGTQDDGAISLERMFTEPETGHLVMQQSYSTLDRITQQLHITWIYDEITSDGTLRRTLAPLLLRYIFSGEIDLMLAMTGLRRVETYGDYSQESFVEGCPRMIVLAEKAPEAE